jgi:hypothetical protein
MAIAGATLAVAPAAPAAAAKKSCRAASTAKGMKIAVQSPGAVVFTKRDKTWGCVFGGKVRRMPAGLTYPDRLTLAGRYVAYVYTGSAIGDETDSIGVVNLRTGKGKDLSKGFSGNYPNEIDTSQQIGAVVLRNNGSVAWTQNTVGLMETGGPIEVHTVGPDGERRVLDSGNIPTGSLALSGDRTTLFWTKDGAAQSAQLP